MVHPLATKVMAEIGIDISRHSSKSIEEFQGRDFDLVVTVCRSTLKLSCPFCSSPGMDGIPMIIRETLHEVKRFVEQGAKANIKVWNQSAELTACRAGLVVCGDLSIAKKIISAEQQLPGDLPVAEKMKELLKFSVSDGYMKIRKTLGIAIATE